MTNLVPGNRTALIRVLFCLAPLLLVGCGKSRLPCVKATCAIKIDGKPYGPVTAQFHREGADPKDRGSSASVDGAGNGQISTYELGDGLPEGDYKVTVVEGGIGASKVAKTYASKSSSPLQVKVFKNTDVINLDLEATKSTGTTGIKIQGAKSSDEMLKEAMPSN